MTVSFRKSKAAGVSYYLNSHDDLLMPSCLLSLRQTNAEWCVAGDTKELTLARLALLEGAWRDAVEDERFKALAEGYSLSAAWERAALVRNAGSGTRVALHDFTLSAPKSVSVLWAFSSVEDRLHIERTQTAAARAFVEAMSAHVYSRRGRGGAVQVPCALVAALFSHRLSRSGDPQLHTHCTFLNVGVCPDGSTGSIETLSMMRALGMAATRYHAVLAAGMHELGFAVRKRGGLFEIDGVPDAVCCAFSLRRNDALAFAQAQSVRSLAGSTPNDWRPSRVAMARAVLRTRPKKRVHDPMDLLQRWRHRAAALGFDSGAVQRLKRIKSDVHPPLEWGPVEGEGRSGGPERPRCST